MKAVLIFFFGLCSVYVYSLKPYTNASPLEAMQKLRFTLKRGPNDEDTEKATVLKEAAQEKKEATETIAELTAGLNKGNKAIFPQQQPVYHALEPSNTPAEAEKLSTKEAEHAKTVAAAKIAEAETVGEHVMKKEEEEKVESAAEEDNIGKKLSDSPESRTDLVKAITNASAGKELAKKTETAMEETANKLQNAERELDAAPAARL